MVTMRHGLTLAALFAMPACKTTENDTTSSKDILTPGFSDSRPVQTTPSPLLTKRLVAIYNDNGTAGSRLELFDADGGKPLNQSVPLDVTLTCSTTKNTITCTRDFWTLTIATKDQKAVWSSSNPAMTKNMSCTSIKTPGIPPGVKWTCTQEQAGGSAQTPPTSGGASQLKIMCEFKSSSEPSDPCVGYAFMFVGIKGGTTGMKLKQDYDPDSGPIRDPKTCASALTDAAINSQLGVNYDGDAKTLTMKGEDSGGTTVQLVIEQLTWEAADVDRPATYNTKYEDSTYEATLACSVSNYSGSGL